MARLRFEIGREPGIEDRLALGFALKARLSIEDGPAPLEPPFPGPPVEVPEPLRHQPHSHCVYGGHRQRGQARSLLVYQGEHFLAFLGVGAPVATARAPLWATVFEPAPGSKERARGWASSRYGTQASNARSREPSCAQRATSLTTPG